MADNFQAPTEESIKHDQVTTDLTTTSETSSEKTPPPPSKGWRFWIILFALCTATILVAIDVSIISTALPTISADLQSEELFVWVANAYILASTAVQPLYGQMANIFGRRSLTLFAVLSFMLGSGLAGGASTTGMLIAGRTIQGIGGGGIITLGEIIMCDLVPLRERGKYTGIIAATYAVGTVLGPILGGVFAESVSWRWIFYINLPIGGVSLALIAPFLTLKYNRQGTMMDRLKRVDIIGNLLLIASVTSILIPLAWAGTRYSWTSWHTLFPLILGFAGMGLFAWFQTSGLVPEPTMPRVLFSNRTSISILGMSFFHGVILIYVTFFLPIYWQAVREKTPIQTGLTSLPISFTIAPSAAFTGIVMSLTGKYRPFHFVGWSLMTISCGLFSIYDEHTSTAVWVISQLIFGIGCGLVYSTMIPPLLAATPSKDVATATSIWSFTRSFGSIWGVATPSAIFNAKVNTLVNERLADVPEVAQLLLNGGAYERATKVFIKALEAQGGPVDVVKSIYLDALRVVWYASIAFALIGVPISLGVKSLVLSKTMDDEFGIETSKDRKNRREESGDEKA
ncbi:MAG: hypothetical protein MMC23_002242 [Stictis urceolatum]|nr:hypothetical protein [Stictis urceolata]